MKRLASAPQLFTTRRSLFAIPAVLSLRFTAASKHGMSKSVIYFLNGPGANLYGLEPSGVYGTESFPQIEARCHAHAASLGVQLAFRQSNHEGVLIDWIQEARLTAHGLIVNGAGLTYTSIAVLDVL